MNSNIMSDKKDAAGQPSSSSALSTQAEQQNQQPNSIRQLMDLLSMGAQPPKKEVKTKYAFWETQPVMQFSESGSSVSTA